MNKYILYSLITVLLTGCVSLYKKNKTLEPEFKTEWFDILPGEKECMVNFVIWAMLPPTGYVALNDGWSVRTDEETGIEKIAIYGEHSCQDVISYYTKMWNTEEKKRVYAARKDTGPTFKISRNIDLECICDSEIVNKIKKETEQPLKNKKE